MQHVTIISRDFLTILVLHQSFKYLNGEAWVFLMISCHDAGAHFGARHAGDGHEGPPGKKRRATGWKNALTTRTHFPRKGSSLEGKSPYFKKIKVGEI